MQLKKRFYQYAVVSAFGVLLTTSSVADVDILDFPNEFAELDPFIVSELRYTSLGQLRADEKGIPETSIPTITAEGDFLVPTYVVPAQTKEILPKEKLNQKGLVKVPENNTVEKQKTDEISIAGAEQAQIRKVGAGHQQGLSKKTGTVQNEQPVARGDIGDIKLPVVKKENVSVSVQPQIQIQPPIQPEIQRPATVQLNPQMQQTAQMAPVVQLPVKEPLKAEIAQPASISVEKKQDVKDNLEQKQIASVKRNTETAAVEQPAEVVESPEIKVVLQQEQQKKPLLIPFGVVQESVVEEELPSVSPVYENRPIPSKYAEQVIRAYRSKNKKYQQYILMPSEIRISFYEGADTISGQGLKWVQAFAAKVIQDPTKKVQVRLSDKEIKLQNRRLKLITATLQGIGVSRHQIDILWTKRDKNSIILRVVERENPDIVKKVKIEEKK